MGTQAPKSLFEQTWDNPSGWGRWFAAVNNQPLGIRYMLTAFAFFTVGGILALLIRVQLTVAENTFLGPHVYNQIFTMHGSTMMYLFAVPFLEGLALYILPMMIGSRDVAFPRLTAFSYWMYLFGGIIFYASFLVGTVPDAGWFAYTPLSGARYSGLGVDFWLLGLSMVEIAGITAGAEIVVTILKLRAPGMAINRMPLFAWALLVSGMMMLFAFTTLLMGTVLLELDRAVGTRFFDPKHGGNTLLWQHLFWFFGHPEVYIMFIPATGIVSMIVTTFSRRGIVAYVLIAVAIVATAFVSFGLWVHHMFTTGLPELASSFFTAASLMIAVASGTQVFAWIATLWGTRPAFRTPLLFVLGFLFLFVLGGMTGVMVAVVPFDLQVHDTFFVVAHFHYVLIGGVLFPIFAGLHYWLPKITGRMLSEVLGQWSFWLTFVGFNLTFFPMHIMGFLGMPRRVYTYPSELGLDWYNIIATVGAGLLGAGFLAFVLNLARSLRGGAPSGPNPWGADALEWAVSSPPPIYTFLKPPMVHARHPLWSEQRHELGPTPFEKAREALDGAPEEWRATLSTDPLTAEPQSVQYLPGPSYFPLVAALGLTLAALGVLTKIYLLAPVGAVFAAIAFLYWMKPDEALIEKIRTSGIDQRAGIPVFTLGSRSIGWWGMISLLVVMGMAYSAFIYSYFYIRLYSAEWPQGGIAEPELLLPGIAFAVLLGTGGAVQWAWRSCRVEGKIRALAGLGITMLGGVAFVAWQGWELYSLGFTPQANAYASLVYLAHWLQMFTALGGLVLLGAVAYRFWRHWRANDNSLALQLQIAALFWYFTVIGGLALFATIYVSPHLLEK